MIPCKVAETLFNDGLDGRLSDEEQNELNFHIEGCAECKASFESLKTVVDMISDSQEEPPEGLVDSISLKIATEKKLSKFFSKRNIMTLVAAAFFIVVARVSMRHDFNPVITFPIDNSSDVVTISPDAIPKIAPATYASNMLAYEPLPEFDIPYSYVIGVESDDDYMEYFRSQFVSSNNFKEVDDTLYVITNEDNIDLIIDDVETRNLSLSRRDEGNDIDIVSVNALIIVKLK